MYLASLGEMLKNSGSNSSTPAMKPPHLLKWRPLRLRSSLKYACQSHRVFGTSTMQSRPARRFCQYASRSTDSGYRPLTPIIAIRSASVVRLRVALCRWLARRAGISLVRAGASGGADRAAALVEVAAAAKSAVNRGE